MSLKREAAWTGLDTLAAAGINFLLRLAIARLLAPDDFGVAALLLTVMAILQAFNDFGFTATLIQRAGDKLSETLVGTTFILSATVSLALFVAMLTFGAAAAETIFDQQGMANYLRVFGVLLLFSPFTTISTALLYRARKFRQIAIIRITSAVTGLIAAALVLAVAPSPWVVVVQALAAGFVSTVLLAASSRFAFPVRFDRNEFKRIFGFSGFVLLSDVIGSVQAQAGVIILGMTLGARLAGFYALAFYLTDTARKMLMSVLNRVTFVHYSRNQHNPVEVRRAFLATVKWNCRAIFPLMLSLILFAPHIIFLFLGNEWQAINAPLRWLALTVMIGTAGGTTSALFKSLGKPRMDFMVMLVTTVMLLLPALYIGSSFYGLVGAAIATCAVKAIAVLVRLYLTGRMFPNLLMPLARQTGHATITLWPIAIVWLIAQLLGGMIEVAHYISLLHIAAAVSGLSIYALLEWPRAFPQTRPPWRR